MNIFSFLYTAGKAQKSLAFLGYVHTLISYAYEAHINNEGVSIMDEAEADVTNKIMFRIKEHFEHNGWTYENLDRMAPQAMREAYNENHVIIDKYFKEEKVYIPSYLALLMLLKVQAWKIIPNDIDISEPLTYYAQKLPAFGGERKRYAHCVRDLCEFHNINKNERSKKKKPKNKEQMEFDKLNRKIISKMDKRIKIEVHK